MDQPPQTPLDALTIAKTLWGVLISGVLFWLTRYTSKVDMLEKNSVTRDELQRELEEMRDERRSMHEENKNLLRDTGGKIDRVDQQVRRLAIQVAAGDRRGNRRGPPEEE